ncbi:hypothetical protein GCM10011363_17560 [Marivita lacus]|uniref:Uncharacterized protein n=1 Tax=Marivita lacus TaxID=1323742 RepID=A0ABQ1KN08_9RHOB|nr:hypothetical protein GCM10011363_17560 [Marivita lacus]
MIGGTTRIVRVIDIAALARHDFLCDGPHPLVLPLHLPPPIALRRKDCKAVVNQVTNRRTVQEKPRGTL